WRASTSSARTSTTPAPTRSTTASARRCWRSAWASRASSPRPAPASTGTPPPRRPPSSAWSAWWTWARTTCGGRSSTASRGGRGAGGRGAGPGEHAAPLGYGRPGVLHGTFSYVPQDADGQTAAVHSVSAGLDYPGVGPEHSHWKDSGRVRYTSVGDDEALKAFGLCSRLEGVLPALETAHAVVEAMRLAAARPKDDIVVVCFSGRGDKD